jgi:hypothetical protein
MQMTINNVDELIKFVNRDDISVKDAVIVCKAFLKAEGIPFNEINTAKESILNAVKNRLDSNIKGLPMVFCKTI